MGKKLVILDDDLVKFALDRCRADEDLAKVAIGRSKRVATAKQMVDYLVKIKRFQAALEDAKDA